MLVPGAKTPHLISAEQVSRMQEGAVLVDVSIDQGGCFETSRMTTHDDPTYVVDGVVHYCVGNMPGAVPRTSTYALDIANNGVAAAAGADPALARGVNTWDGILTNQGVAAAHGIAFSPFAEVSG